MNFFESYADLVMLELNEDGSNIGDIVVDWEQLCKKESTTNSNDTSNAAPTTKHNNRPFKDGNMPGRTNPAFKPNEAEETIKLRKIWRNNTTTKLSRSEPVHLNNHHLKGEHVIVRKVDTTFRRKQLGNKSGPVVK
ncbi:hypothetical protein PHABIO_188 [Pseudomonas phage Phabio]|uniref:Uncharacterized protein n=1 Tax=Pseudomonas phage Phabio TaxID=2006668 RepID=A0A1Y0SZ79_9CAUD|nr:hypothetical protein MZD05_gp188 [Pseudomonas phage Phabio]ARV76819.1 hypothetical protein PHABIO_188 [Pseudomonas phage Phabio]